MEENKKKISVSTIVVTVIAIIIIVALAVLFYYYSEKLKSLPASELVDYENKNVPAKKPKTPIIEATSIIVFKVPDVLPESTKQGKCLGSSVAEPFREDAFRCQVSNQIYDPCFSTAQKGVVFCQINPLVNDSFLIKLTQALPKPSLPKEKLTNWAWFVRLEDGTLCSPFTGTRLIVQGETANYGCSSKNPPASGEQIVLMGALTEAVIWSAEKAVLVKNGTNLSIKSSEQVSIDTVWQ